MTACRWTVVGLVATALGATFVGVSPADEAEKSPEKPAAKSAEKGSTPVPAKATTEPIKPRPIEPWMEKGIGWLIEAQHSSGGWGGGSHAKQNVRDPHAVKPDPATTSFSALALMRTGHTPTKGKYKESVRKAVEFLVGQVEKSSEDGPRITDLKGTQPQTKLGGLIDTTMTAHFLSRVVTELPETDKLRGRTERALAKCVRKLEMAQNKDGSWNSSGGGAWAPVLQSAWTCSALECAKAVGVQVDNDKLAKARDYNRKNYNTKTGRADARAGAGVELYSFAGAQRSNAAAAKQAQDVVAKAKAEGKVDPSAPVSEDSLKKAGLNEKDAKLFADASEQNRQQAARIANDGRLLAGFGNNGGEEFISFLMTSEALIITGGESFAKWNDKMHTLLAKAQNPDGSWSGHHCITSPVFCTAAALQVLTCDRDAEILRKIAESGDVVLKEGERKDAPVQEQSGRLRFLPGGRTPVPLAEPAVLSPKSAVVEVQVDETRPVEPKIKKSR